MAIASMVGSLDEQKTEIRHSAAAAERNGGQMPPDHQHFATRAASPALRETAVSQSSLSAFGIGS
jgi:hypothetical protein